MADQNLVLIPPVLQEGIVQRCKSGHTNELEVLGAFAHDLEELAKKLGETGSRTAARPIFRAAAELRLAASRGC